MTDLPPVSSSTEDCLEAILQLISEKGAARVRDIATVLSLHKSTVSSTLKGLSEKGLVHYSPYEITTLTPLGEEIAQDVRRRHLAIGRFLAEILGADEHEAQANACRMEHIVDADILDRFCLLMDFAKNSAAKGDNWVERFHHYSKTKLRGKARREEQPSNATTLDRLKPGRKAEIIKVGGAGAIRRRMADMGLLRGAAIEVIKVAPLGDPIEVKIKGYNLSLRKEEAATIEVNGQGTGGKGLGAADSK